ncbi:MAG: hypothetical protein CM1200mP2_56100 [Planctomycetaceae bacterium]|nr:MAG: hypothetical protein CM1200mP2_56100 [Planctomycetaceae bacterium]
MARYPRPAFAERFTGTPRAAIRNCPWPPCRPGPFGHPKLMTALGDALKSTHPPRRNAALTILASGPTRTARSWPSKRAQEARVDSAGQHHDLLLIRTRDPRPIPMLLKHRANSPASRSTVIKTLIQVGTRTSPPSCGKHYPKLSNTDRANVLEPWGRSTSNLPQARSRRPGLEQQHPGQRRLPDASAGRLATGRRHARQGLQFDKLSTTWNYTANALAGIGTSEARKVLEAARPRKKTTSGTTRSTPCGT